MAPSRGDDRHRPSSPLQGDDVFHTRSQARHNSPFFKLGADDGDDFWSNIDERNAQHRQHLKWLLIAFVAASTVALIVHTTLLVFVLPLLIPIGVEVAMIRRTRSRVKIPDYRPKQPAEIDLDDR